MRVRAVLTARTQGGADLPTCLTFHPSSQLSPWRRVKRQSVRVSVRRAKLGTAYLIALMSIWAGAKRNASLLCPGRQSPRRYTPGKLSLVATSGLLPRISVR